MPYARDFTINGFATGLALKAALRASDGTLHTTFRDVALAEVGGGVYCLTSTAWPDAYRGAAIIYTGTLGSATNLTGVAVKLGLAVNPEECELVAGIKDNTDLLGGDVTLAGPVAVLDVNKQLNLIQGDGYETATRIPKWTIENYVGPDLTSGTGKLRFADYSAYKLAATAPAVLVVDATVAVSGTTVTITAVLHESDTAQLKTSPSTVKVTHVYQLIVSTAASEDVTILIGNCLVTRRVDPLP